MARGDGDRADQERYVDGQGGGADGDVEPVGPGAAHDTIAGGAGGAAGHGLLGECVEEKPCGEADCGGEAKAREPDGWAYFRARRGGRVVLRFVFFVSAGHGRPQSC